MKNAVEFKHIIKRFADVSVLKNVNFSIKEGEVHALLGENGAGKSTLLNILHGVYADYDGEVYLDDSKVHFKTPHDAIIKGRITKVHQEINIVQDLTVGQNITLGYEPSRGLVVDYKKLNKNVDKILEKLQCDFKSEDMASTLTAGQAQMLAIAKALFHESKVISLDEPTASLTANETESLFRIINELKKANITIIYVSHRLEEIFQICDRATILRDGEYITTLEIKDTNRDELIRYMVGRNINAVASRMQESCVKEEEVLKVTDFSNGETFQDVNFNLKKGEILGFFGLVGAGRTEVMRAIFGADKKISGKVFLNGEPVEIKNTRDALKYGIGLLPEERKTQGFIKFTTNTDNVSISCLEKFLTYRFVDDSKKLENYKHFVKELNINPKNPGFLTENMSGGNQQKVIIARWLSTDVDILIFDEPTKGVDVAVRAEIYRLMESIVQAGKSIIVVSSDLSEIMGISDRIITMCEGRITAELTKEEFYDQTILNYAMGGK